MNVGVTLVPCSLATAPFIPTSKSTFTKAILFVRPPALASARLSNTGAIILHGPHEAEVKNATTALYVRKIVRMNEGFVQTWIGEVALVVGGESAGVATAAREDPGCCTDAVCGGKG